MAGILNFCQKFKKANQVRERDDKPGLAEWIGKNNWLNKSHKTHSAVSFARTINGEKTPFLFDTTGSTGWPMARLFYRHPLQDGPAPNKKPVLRTYTTTFWRARLSKRRPLSSLLVLSPHPNKTWPQKFLVGKKTFQFPAVEFEWTQLYKL
jgi:hypothetical protein